MRVVLLSSEWRTKRDELSTFNRELAIQLAKHPDVQVSVFLPRCDQDEKDEALSHNITLVQATRRPGFDDETQWLCFPPKDLQFDFVIGHGVKLGHQAQVIKEHRNCNWIQFVHTDPEERGMFKDCPDAISEGEKKRQDEVDLCAEADLVVAVGSKIEDAYRTYLRFCEKDQNVFVLTPGIFSDFSNIPKSNQTGSKFRVLAFGHGGAEDFRVKGFDIAAKAVGQLNDALLIFVDAKQQDEVASRLKECDISPSRLRVRSFTEIRERLKQQFSEVDLAIMPSRTEGFGLAALEAMSAGLPVLVSANSGFGEALGEVAFGSYYVVHSEDADVWARKIDEVLAKRRELRLGEAEALCDSYAKKYDWEEQCRDLVEKMRGILNEPFSSGVAIPEELDQQPDAELSEAVYQPQLTKQPQLCEERNAYRTKEEAAVYESTLDQGAFSRQVLLPLKIITPDLTEEQQEIINKDLKDQIQRYKRHHDLSTTEGVKSLIKFIIKSYNVSVESLGIGCLEMIVQCPKLESLERLWSDCCSGVLDKVAERYLVTSELKRKLNLETVRMKTTITQEKYLMCKKALVEIEGAPDSADTSSQPTEPDQGESASWSGTGLPRSAESSSQAWTGTGLPGSAESSSQAAEPDQEASESWTGTELPGSAESLSEEIKPDQKVSTSWTGTGLPGSDDSSSQAAEPDQEASESWTGTGIPGSAESLSEEIKPDQEASEGWTGTGVPDSDDSSSKEIEPDQGVSAKWTGTSSDFQEDPILSQQWQEVQKSTVFNKKGYDICVKFLLQTGLITKFSPSPDVVKYLITKELRKLPDCFSRQEPSQSDPCPLYVHFVDGFVPFGLFTQLVSQTVRWCCMTEPAQSPKLFRDGAWFVIGGKIVYYLILIYKTRFIKIVLKQKTHRQKVSKQNSIEIAPQVREFVERCLHDLSQDLPYMKGLLYQLCVKCPYCQQEKTKCKNHKQGSCTHEDYIHLLELNQDKPLICEESFGDEYLTVPGQEKWFFQRPNQALLGEISSQEQPGVSGDEMPISSVPKGGSLMSSAPQKYSGETGDEVPVSASLKKRCVRDSSSRDSKRFKLTTVEVGQVLRDVQQMQHEARGGIRKTSLLVGLKKIASSKGFIISDNDGSGNCMFYALSEQLDLVKGIQISHAELRQHLVTYLKENPTLPDGTELFNFVDRYDSWTDYLNKMAADGTWGDHVILHAAANCFETYIQVISSLLEQHDIIITPERDVGSSRPLVLGHVHEHHFVSLRRKQGTNEEGVSSSEKESQSILGIPDIDPLIRLVIRYSQGLSEEQQDDANQILAHHLRFYMEHHDLSTDFVERMGGLMEYMEGAIDLTLEAMGK